MNGNRMKYASTPTYGMQKRSLFKKPAPARQTAETPDFSKAPGTAAASSFQPSFAPPPFPQQPVMQQPPYAPSAPTFPQVGAIPMQQPVQVPFAAPSFVPPVSGMQMPPVQTPPVQNAQQLPLGNTVSPFQNGGSFSARSQGFVPPQINPQPSPMQKAAAPQPPFQPPFSGMNSIPQQTPGFVQQPMPYPSAMQPTAPQQPAFPSQPPVRERKPLNADTFWSLFLFALLPLLFIPCLFVPASWDLLRYIFLGLTVVGLGAMWYRQMYRPTTRLIVSMAYVALCVAVIAMVVQGTNDAKQTSGVFRQPVSQQQTPVPESNVAVPVGTPEAVIPQETPEPLIGPSEAERRLELFMSLWQMNNTSEMVHLVQPSWCSRQENPSQELFKVLMNRTPEDFVIEEVSGTETDNSRTVTMRATISKNNNKAPVIYRFMVMMVREGNEWYVNPNSLATNDTVEEPTDENVVNNKNAVGNVTEPPRTTVTPPPPASTLLYYNEGANFYHMDPNCISVKAEYLPFDISFPYSELKTVRKEMGLSPCLKCNAPTNTLD